MNRSSNCPCELDPVQSLKTCLARRALTKFMRSRMQNLIRSLLLIALTIPVWAQSAATIVGRVTDSSGAILSGAEVTALNND